MPRKIKALIKDLEDAGFSKIPGGKGSHRKFTHAKFSGAVTLSGKSNADAKPYQEKQVNKAIKAANDEND
ncbi:MAG: type II toxin-antitoxin system HicA family toxin [Phycisphaerales bacterium JB063]